MTRKFIPKIKKTLSTINHAMMVVAVLISFSLWYLNKLGHTYTTTITLPLTVVNSAESAIGVLENENNVECRVEGTGYELLKYRIHPKRYAIQVELRRIDLRPIEGSDKSEVTHSSIYNAVFEQFSDLRLLSVLTPRIEITTAPFQVKKVPVLNRIQVDYRNQYMQVGKTVIAPDSIEVKSLGLVLDTLQAVYTQKRNFSNVNGPLAGRLELEPIPNVVFAVDETEFRVTVEEYTEIEQNLPITLLNAPEGVLPVILPGEVLVKLNVARSRYNQASSGEIRAYIDYADRLTNIGKQYKVYVPVSEGIVVKEVSPIYVELVFEEL